jgi:hypothetical protein
MADSHYSNCQQRAKLIHGGFEMTALRIFAAAALGAITLGAGAAVHAASAEDACTLLTAAEVGNALGSAVDAGGHVTPTFLKTCTWTSSTKGGGTVTLNLQSAEQFDSGRKLAAYGKSVSAVSVGGIGDDAYFFGPAPLTSLIVRKGAHAFKIAVYAKIPADKQQAVEKSLASLVVGKL